MKLFCFGLGYSASHLARTRRALFDSVSGTVTTAEKQQRLAGEGIPTFLLDGDQADPAIAQALDIADTVVVSIPPSGEGDLVLARFGEVLARSKTLTSIAYLSTIGVYGDHGGAWVDETMAVAPKSRRSLARADAEQAWLGFGETTGKAVQVFRLAGIYGPGRNALAQLQAGTAKRIVKPGQVFNRIHVEDIAQALVAAMTRPRPGAIYNLADDEPSPPQDVVAYAAALTGREPPPEIAFDAATMSPMAASFWGEVKRASNRRIKAELGMVLRYPTYREGLVALHAAGEGG